MNDAAATVVGFVVSFSLLLSYAVWLMVESRRTLKANRHRRSGNELSMARTEQRESVATELKPHSRIKAS